MKGVAQTFHSKVRLRGKGSGFLEGSHALELDAPLQLWLSCHEWMNYVGAVGALYELLRDLHKHYRRYARAQCMEPPALKIIYSEERRRDLDAERNSKLIHVEDQWARPSWPRRRWWTSTRGSYGNFPLLKKATKDSLQACGRCVVNLQGKRWKIQDVDITMTGRELRKMISDMLPAKAGSCISVQFGSTPLSLEQTLMQQGIVGCVVLPVGCDPTGKALPPCSWNVGGRRDSGNSWRHYPAGCMGDDCVKKPWHQLSWLKGFAPEVARRPGSVAREQRHLDWSKSPGPHVYTFREKLAVKLKSQVPGPGQYPVKRSLGASAHMLPCERRFWPGSAQRGNPRNRGCRCVWFFQCRKSSFPGPGVYDVPRQTPRGIDALHSGWSMSSGPVRELKFTTIL
eukprot:g18519.t1